LVHGQAPSRAFYTLLRIKYQYTLQRIKWTYTLERIERSITQSHFERIAILKVIAQLEHEELLIGTILPGCVPVVDLKTEKDAEDDDHGFDEDRESVLPAESGGDATKNHHFVSSRAAGRFSERR
jgi:hypothetical protein